MIIRLGYCPQNPGWKWKGLKKIKWYSDVNEAISDYDGQSIWVSYGGRYREITYQQLLDL
jgi:hypothetical protein